MKFQFLSKAAKQKAVEWYSQCESEEFDGSCVLEDACPVPGFLGFTVAIDDIAWSGFSSQGDGASFKGYWRACEVDMAALKSRAPQDKDLEGYCAQLSVLALRYPDARGTIGNSTGHYYHSGGMYIDALHTSGADYEDGGDDERRDDDQKELLECAKGLADWIYCQLETEYDYRTGEENCIGGIRANDYDFDTDGTIR